MRTRRELADFVATLPVPKDRRDIVQMELDDHVFESIAELEASGVPTGEAERRSVEALGDPAALRERLIDAQLAWSVAPREGLLLGIRTGAFVAAVALGAGWIDGNPFPGHPFMVTHVDWMKPSALYYVIAALSLLAAWPSRVNRPFLAAQRHARAARRAGNVDAVRRLQEPISQFLAGLLCTASAPFFFWIFAVGIGIPLGTLEGPLLRTILATFVVNMTVCAIAAVALLQASPEKTRRKGHIA